MQKHICKKSSTYHGVNNDKFLLSQKVKKCVYEGGKHGWTGVGSSPCPALPWDGEASTVPAPGAPCDAANVLCDASFASRCALLGFSKMTYD